MKLLSALFLTMVLSSLFAVAADQPQPPAEGSHAPIFSLPNQEGTQVSLDQFTGKWVVLYFYPKDFSSGCTIEAHNFQRDIDKYTQECGDRRRQRGQCAFSSELLHQRRLKLQAARRFDPCGRSKIRLDRGVQWNDFGRPQHLFDRSYGRNQKDLS